MRIKYELDKGGYGKTPCPREKFVRVGTLPCLICPRCIRHDEKAQTVDCEGEE